MPQYQKNISGMTTMVIPSEMGSERPLAFWYAMYPGSDWWGQFIILHDGSNSTLFYVNDPDPECQYWQLTATTLTITNWSAQPVNVVEVPYSGTDWKVGAAIYRDWAKDQIWYARKDHRYHKMDYFTICSYFDGAKETTGKHAARVPTHLPGLIGSFFSLYRTEPFNVRFPDHTVDTANNAHVGFKHAKDGGTLVCPYLNFHWWGSDASGYDYQQMKWMEGYDVVSSITESAGSYTFTLNASPLPPPAGFSGNVVVDDEFVITACTNTNLNNQRFVVTSVTDNLNFVCSGTPGMGNATDGLVHLIQRFNPSTATGKLLKHMCPASSAATARLQTEIAQLVDSDGLDTAGLYFDTVGGGKAWPCFNPLHGHAVGDGRQYVQDTRKKVSLLANHRFIVSESFSEPYLGLADYHLSMPHSGSRADGFEIPLFNFVYGGIAVDIGWNNDGTDDASWAAHMQGAIDIGRSCNGSYSGSGNEINIFDATWPTSLAKLYTLNPVRRQARGLKTHRFRGNYG